MKEKFLLKKAVVEFKDGGYFYNLQFEDSKGELLSTSAEKREDCLPMTFNPEAIINLSLTVWGNK